MPTVVLAINNYFPLQDEDEDEEDIAVTDSQSLDRLSIQTQEEDYLLGGRVADWAKDFDNLLSDKYGLYKFTEFLRQEFSHENIYFWCACEKFRLIEAAEERLTAARNILARHLQPGAVEPVNIDAASRLKLVTEPLGVPPPPDHFISAQNQIYNLMRFDSYPRFLKCRLYTECVRRELTGNSLNDCSSDLSGLDELPVRASDGVGPTMRQRGKHKERSEKNRLSIFWDSWGRKEGEDSFGMRREGSRGEGECTLTRVILPNGSTSVVNTTSGESIRALVSRLLEKRGLKLSSFEVLTTAGEKQLDLSEDCDILGCTEVRVEQRVNFKLEIPGQRTLSVKTKTCKRVRDVLAPLLRQYHWDLAETAVLAEDGNTVDIDIDVKDIDNRKLLVRPNREGSCRDSSSVDPEISLFEGLQIMRKGRLEDQRGTEISFEIPDFLKIQSGHGRHTSLPPAALSGAIVTTGPASMQVDTAGKKHVSLMAREHVSLMARGEFEDSSPTLGFV